MLLKETKKLKPLGNTYVGICSLRIKATTFPYGLQGQKDQGQAKTNAEIHKEDFIRGSFINCVDKLGGGGVSQISTIMHKSM